MQGGDDQTTVAGLLLTPLHERRSPEMATGALAALISVWWS